MSDYLAPEIQDMSRSKIVWKKEHDYFALAVHLFQILMENRHPFMATPVIGIAPAEYATKLIAKGIYPHVRNQATKRDHITDILPARIKEAFRKTFMDGFRDPSQRFTPEDWVFLLRKELKALRQCDACPEQFEAHAPHCPYCGAVPVERSTKVWSFITEQVQQVKSLPALALKPLFKLAANRGAAPQRTPRPRKHISMRKRVLITAIPVAAIALIAGTMLFKKSRSSGYIPTPSYYTASTSEPKVPSAPRPATETRPLKKPLSPPEMNFSQLASFMSRSGIISESASVIRRSPDGKHRYEYESQDYKFQDDALIEFNRILTRISRYAVRTGLFREEPHPELHPHFMKGRLYRSGSRSILLVIERYTDKHRIVLIAQ